MVVKTNKIKKECEPILEYHIKKWKFWLIILPFKLVFLGVAFYISYFVLYQGCMYKNCNYIVTVFFAILALSFLSSSIGVPPTKFIENLKLT